MKSILSKTVFFFLIASIGFFVFSKNKNPHSYEYILLKDDNREIIISGNSHLGFEPVAYGFSFEKINIANKGRGLEAGIDILTKRIETKNVIILNSNEFKSVVFRLL